jgi:LMBR1 domain-containing protein 1
MLVWLPHLLIPAILAGLLFFFYLFIRHYIERDKVYFGTLICSAILLVSVTFTLLLVPLDVYSVSSDAASGIAALRTVLKIAYYTGYIAVIFSLIITLPFCYFYYEAATDYEHQRNKRIVQALKYTAFFILAFIILVGTAFIIKALRTEHTDEDWRKRIIGELTNWEAFVVFLVSILSVIGLIAYVPYVAYGLSVFPIFLIKGRQNPVTEEREFLLAEEKDLEVAKKTQTQSAHDRHRASSLNGGSSTTLSKMANKYGYKSKNEDGFVRKDHKLRDTERRLEENRIKQNALTNESAYWAKCWSCLGPFRVIFGIIFLALSLLIIAQQIMSLIERILNSSCGWKCGFTPDLNKVSIPNPFDFVFKQIAPAFPIDLIFFTILLSYLSLCIIYSVTQLGVRILTVKLSSIRAANTPANAMIIAVAFIAFSLLSMNSQIVQSIPGYTTFGKQTYVPSESTDNIRVQQVHNVDVDAGVLNKDIHGDNINHRSRKFGAVFAKLIDVNSDEQIQDNIIYSQNILQQNNTSNSLQDEPKKPLPCDFEHANLDGQCRVTEFAAFMQKSNNFLPFFSIIQLIATCTLLLFYVIFSIYALCKKPETDKLWQSDDPDAPNYVPS